MTPDEIKELEDDGYRVFLEHRIYASISKLADITGLDRRTVANRLKGEGINYHGDRNALLFATDQALPILCRETRRRR